MVVNMREARILNLSTKQTEQNEMITVKISYKSGKIEVVEMNITDYSKALKSLAEEGRLTGMEIVK